MMFLDEARKELLKQAVVDYIRKHDRATYVNIEQIFTEHGFDFAGDYAQSSDLYENIVYWNGWNDEAIQIIRELLDEGLIHMRGSDYYAYLFDGKILTFPLVKQIYQYKTEHWLPVCFKLTPMK